VSVGLSIEIVQVDLEGLVETDEPADYGDLMEGLEVVKIQFNAVLGCQNLPNEFELGDGLDGLALHALQQRLQFFHFR
jgi:hypothetical protein